MIKETQAFKSLILNKSTMSEYSQEYLNELALMASKFFREEIPKRRHDCKEAGSHKDVVWYPYFIG